MGGRALSGEDEDLLAMWGFDHDTCEAWAGHEEFAEEEVEQEAG